jgi:pimeloyl-ACP methyl ester carboxylesterase
MKLWLKRIVIGLGYLLGALVLAGTIFEAIARQQIAQQYPAPGKLIDIGGRRIQIDCRGAGSPTVVLESGLDNFGSLSWAKVHDAIAQTTRVCAYSRAGIMWSDPNPADFDSQQTAQDLHTALTNAGEQAPLVMVGHSLGGPHVLTFTSLYDREVAGFVLVDASHPDQIDRFRKVIGSVADEVPLLLKIPPIIADLGANIGIVRLMNLCPPVEEKIPEITTKAGCAYLPQTVSSNLKAAQSSTITINHAKNLRKLGDRPLVVLTAMQKINPEDLKTAGLSEEQGQKAEAVWKDLQADEATWSSHSRHEILTDATHYIQFDRPDAVIKAVKEVVTDVRAAKAIKNPNKPNT